MTLTMRMTTWLPLLILCGVHTGSSSEDCYFKRFEQYAINGYNIRLPGVADVESCYRHCMDLHDEADVYCKAVDYADGQVCSVHTRNSDEAGSDFALINPASGTVSLYEKTCHDQGNFRSVVFHAAVGQRVENVTATSTARVDSQFECAQMCQKYDCYYFNLQSSGQHFRCQVFPIKMTMPIVADPNTLMYWKDLHIVDSIP